MKLERYPEALTNDRLNDIANSQLEKGYEERGYEVRVLRKEKGATIRKLTDGLKNSWTTVHPRLNEKSPMEILTGRRSMPKHHQSSEYVPEEGIGRQERVRNQQKDT